MKKTISISKWKKKSVRVKRSTQNHLKIKSQKEDLKEVLKKCFLTGLCRSY